MEKKDTRHEILRIGTDLIARQGFNATGIDAVLKAAGVPKGSFYHYFKSKDDFGLAVIDHFAAGFARRLEAFLEDEEVGPCDRLRNFFESSLARVTQNQCTRGCLIGNLGQELAGFNEGFRARLDAIFGHWRGSFATCLRRAQELGELAPELDAELVAGFLLSGWEGAILRAKVMKSPQPMRDFIDVVFATTLLRR